MIEKPYTCGGFLFINHRPSMSLPEDYFDFKDYTWAFGDLIRDLHGGCLPAGMIINAANYQPMVVIRDDVDKLNPLYFMVPLVEVYRNLSYHPAISEVTEVESNTEVIADV